MEQGLYFWHEDPVGAWSWRPEEVRRFVDDPRVTTANGSMCAFGMYQEDENGKALL